MASEAIKKVLANVAQNFTNEEKQQARDNIGAAANITASSSSNGLMSSSDKVKLDSIQSGAEVNVQSNWNQTDNTKDDFIKNKPENLVQDASYVHTDNNFTNAEKTKLAGIEAGAEVNVQADWNQTNTSADDYIKNKPSIPASQVQSDWNQSDNTQVDFIKNKPSNLVQDASYVHTDNNFTTTLKDKLDGIAAGAEVNVQADWNQTDNTKDDYIKNKPTIPAAQVNSDWNASSGAAKILNKPSIPSKTSDLTNDSGFITSSDVPAQVQSDWNETDSSDPAYIKNKPSIPASQVQSDWNQSDNTQVDFIKNKPSNLVQDASYVHTDNNFTTSEKTKLAGIEAGAEVNVQSDWNQSDNTKDDYIKNKPSNIVQDASYVHTDNNFTNAEKTKLSGIEANAEVNVQSDWSQSDSSADDYIKNKPSNLVQDASYVHTDNNFTTTLKDKLDGIASGAQVNVQADWNQSDSSADDYIKNKPTIPAAQVNSDWNAMGGVAEILNKPESKYFLWDTAPTHGFGIWANIYDASDHYTAWLPICLLTDDPDTSSSNTATLHTNFSSTQQSGITVYNEVMTTAYLTRATSSHLALSKGLWFYEFDIELEPTQIVSGIANMKIQVRSQVYDSPSSIPSNYMIKTIEAPINCDIQVTRTRSVSGVVYSTRDFRFDNEGFLSFGQTLSVMFDIDRDTVPTGAAFKFRQTSLHLVKLGI